MIKVFILNFINLNNNYFIHDLDDSIPGVYYRINLKGWMDQTLFAQYFAQLRVFDSNIRGHPKVVWVDNYMDYNMTLRLKTILEARQIILKYVPPYSTHFCQPVDIFITSKVKDVWTIRSEAKKSELIATNTWYNTHWTDGHWFEKLTNLG